MKNSVYVKLTGWDGGQLPTSSRFPARPENPIDASNSPLVTIRTLSEIVKPFPEIVNDHPETFKALSETVRGHAEMYKVLPEIVNALPETVRGLPEMFKPLPVP